MQVCEQGFLSNNSSKESFHLPPQQQRSLLHLLPGAKDILNLGSKFQREEMPRIIQTVGRPHRRYFPACLFDSEGVAYETPFVEAEECAKKVRPPETLEERYQEQSPVYRKSEVSSVFGFFCEEYISKESIANSDRVSCEHFQLDESILKAPSGEGRAGLLGAVQFSSNFESGNLFAAYRTGQNEYDLLIQNDTNTKGYNQWFYFEISGLMKYQAVRLDIVNFVNKNTLFRKGMRPVLFSRAMFLERGIGWHEGGSNVRFRSQNLFRRDGVPYFSLSFQLRAEHSEDRILVASNWVYPYSRMMHFIDRVHQISHGVSIAKHFVCHSPCKNSVYALEVAGRGCVRRRTIAVMARQHPGESNSSFVMEGLLKWLASGCYQAKALLSRYTVIAVPLLNPDGVVAGNFRSSVAGVDLNRRWTAPDRVLHEQVYRVKEYLLKFRPLAYFIDLHGHSRSLNSFAYCSKSVEEDECLLPAILNEISSSFRFKQCNFTYDPFKEDTARLNLIREGAKRALTLQTSMWAYQDETDKQMVRFTPQQMRKLGAELGEALAVHFAGVTVRGVNKKGAKNALATFGEPKPQFDRSDSDPAQDELNQDMQTVKQPKQKERGIATMVRAPSQMSKVLAAKSARVQIVNRSTDSKKSFTRCNNTSRMSVRKPIKTEFGSALCVGSRKIVGLKTGQKIMQHRHQAASSMVEYSRRLKTSIGPKMVLNMNVIDLGSRLATGNKNALRPQLKMRRKLHSHSQSVTQRFEESSLERWV